MNLGHILPFLVQHAETIFSVTLGIVLLLSGYLIYRSYFTPEASGHEATAADLNRIEESLRKIISQTGHLPTASELAAAAPTPAPATDGTASASAQNAAPTTSADDAQLRAEIEARNRQIEELKKQLEAVKSQDNTPELLAKIKSLEDRLNEYEIIEDDIADLSFYKEENAKLKKELEALKGGSPAAASGVVPPSTPATQANLLEEFDAAVQNLEKQKAAEAATETPVATAPSESQNESSTVVGQTPEEILAQALSETATTLTETPSAEQPKVEEKTETAEEKSANADIFAEMQGDSQGTDLLAELGDIDADRMLEEIKDLGEGMGDAGVLEEGLDLEKLASEAEKKG